MQTPHDAAINHPFAANTIDRFRFRLRVWLLLISPNFNFICKFGEFVNGICGGGGGRIRLVGMNETVTVTGADDAMENQFNSMRPHTTMAATQSLRSS